MNYFEIITWLVIIQKLRSDWLKQVTWQTMIWFQPSWVGFISLDRKQCCLVSEKAILAKKMRPTVKINIFHNATHFFIGQVDRSLGTLESITQFYNSNPYWKFYFMKRWIPSGICSFKLDFSYSPGIVTSAIISSFKPVDQF